MRIVLVVFVLAAVFLPEWGLRYFPVFLNLALCWIFARTLLSGREPIISLIARLERGTLTPELSQYTQRLTCIWSATFLLLAGVSLALALREASAWAFVAGYLPVAVLFFGEHVFRRIRYPHYEHASPWQVIRRIRRSGALFGLPK
jgi:uncharacterized membrane protein